MLFLKDLLTKASPVVALWWPWALLALACSMLARRIFRQGWRAFLADARNAARMAALMGSFKSARGAFLRRALARRLGFLIKAPASLLLFCRPVRLCASRMSLAAIIALIFCLAAPLWPSNNVQGWVVLPLSASYAGEPPCEEVEASIAPSFHQDPSFRDPLAPKIAFSLLSFPADQRWKTPRSSSFLAVSSSTFDLAASNARAYLAFFQNNPDSGISAAALALADPKSKFQIIPPQGSIFKALRSLESSARLTPCGFNPAAFLSSAQKAVGVPWSSASSWIAYLTPSSGAFLNVQAAANAGFENPKAAFPAGVQQAAQAQAEAWTRLHGPETLRELAPMWLSVLAMFGSLYLSLMGAGEILAHSRGFSLASNDRERALFERARLEDDLRKVNLHSQPAARRARL